MNQTQKSNPELIKLTTQHDKKNTKGQEKNNFFCNINEPISAGVYEVKLGTEQMELMSVPKIREVAPVSTAFSLACSITIISDSRDFTPKKTHHESYNKNTRWK